MVCHVMLRYKWVGYNHFAIDYKAVKQSYGSIQKQMGHVKLQITTEQSTNKPLVLLYQELQDKKHCHIIQMHVCLINTILMLH